AGASPRCLAATDDVALMTDRIQTDTNQGPCLEAAEEHSVIESRDLSVETRWPAFCARVLAETPVRSILTFELSEEQPPSALNLYSGTTDAFEPGAISAAGLFAAHAQVAVM